MAVKAEIEQFVEDYLRIEGEKQLLAEELKALFDDMKEKTDVKALKAAIRIAKIRSRLGDAESEMENILAVVDGKVI